MTYVANSPVVLVKYDDLVKGVDVSASIKAAYGSEVRCVDATSELSVRFGFTLQGLGIMAIQGVPKFTDARSALLPLAHKSARCSPSHPIKIALTGSLACPRRRN